jgi:hypothetical protein
MVEFIGAVEDWAVEAKLDFMARDLVADQVKAGAEFLVMEGSRPVAEAVVTEVF